MRKKKVVPAVLALYVLMGIAPAWAENPADRAVQKREAEQRIEKLEEGIEEAQVDGRIAEAHLELARRHAELAGKLLNVHNTRASKAVTELAERFLAQAKGTEVRE